MERVPNFENCPFCNADSKSFVKLKPNGTGVVKSDIKVAIKHANLEFMVCKECSSVVYIGVKGLDKLL